MTEERPKRASIGEKRAVMTTLNLGPELLEDITTAEVDWTHADLVEVSHKKPISLRVDPDVLEFFRSGGSGYQTRINAVLRAFMVAKKKLTQR